MPPVVIVVPAELALPVLDGLLALYDTKVDVLSHGLKEHLAGDASFAVQLKEREALVRIDAVIEQIGWERVPRLADVSIEAELEIIAAAAYEVLAIRANQLEIVCEESEFPDGDLSPVTQAIAKVVDAHYLLLAIEQSGHREAIGPEPSDPT